MDDKYMNNLKRIKSGQQAPLFTAKDYKGNELSLENYRGKKVLLSFHVFGSCPFCNLRVKELGEKYSEWNTKGFDMIHVFPSSAETIIKYAGKDDPPFAVLSDPQKELYQMYGLQKSVIGMFKGFLKVKRLFQAFKVVGLFNSLRNNDAAMHQLPADFLINENGIIENAYYASTTSDNLPVKQIDDFVNNYKN